MIDFLVFAVLSAPVLYEQQNPPQPPTFRTEVRRVYVDAFVTRDGKPVRGLETGDFEILDNGIPQQDIEVLDTADYPLSAVLLLDTSASGLGPKLEQLKDAAKTFINGLTYRDEIGIVTFSNRYRLRQSLTVTRDLDRRAVDSITGIGAATALLDSLYAATIHAESGSGRPLVVLFTDGDDNSSWLTIEEIVKTAKTSDAVIYAVRAASGGGVFLGGTDTQGAYVAESARDVHGRRVLEEVTQATGGRFVPVESPVALSETFAEILREMRSRYLLFYEPRDPLVEGWHTLEVRLKRGKKGKVRARAGYFLR